MRLRYAGKKVGIAYMLKLDSAPVMMIQRIVGIFKTDQ